MKEFVIRTDSQAAAFRHSVCERCNWFLRCFWIILFSFLSLQLNPPPRVQKGGGTNVLLASIAQCTLTFKYVAPALLPDAADELSVRNPAKKCIVTCPVDVHSPFDIAAEQTYSR